MKPTPEMIESRLAELDPEIEFLALEPAGNDRFRIVLDHPEGVTLELCAQVTGQLGEILSDHGLEVSSPGSERPLTRPEHFERFIGCRARVSTREPLAGRSNFAGTIRQGDAVSIGIESDGTLFRIPLDDIKRAHLAPEIPEGAGK